MIDTSPGSPDGPPVEPKDTIWAKAGFVLGISIVLLAIAFSVVGMAWAIAWMVTHFPGVS